MIENEDWLQAAWAEREEIVYKRDFDSLGPGIHTLNLEVFNRLGITEASEVDPRWLFVGAFESPPASARASWIYVTSGLSNAWNADTPDSAAWSGMGMEFIIECDTQSPWALFLILNLAAYQLLLGAGKFDGRKPMDFWSRTGVGSPIDFADSSLKALLFVPAPHFMGPRYILSGRFEYLQAIGLTADEHAYGKEAGYDVLHEQLLSKNASPVISRNRISIL